MGSTASSIESTSLEVRSPTNSQSEVLEGELVVCCRNRLKLDRDVRVTLKLQANLVTLTERADESKARMTQNKQIIWEVGGVIRKRGTFLEAGENRLAFNFPLNGKLSDTNKLIDPKDLLQKFGKCSFIKYEYLLRAGSIQIQELVRSPPKLFPPGENGLRIIDPRMNSDPQMKSKLASCLSASVDIADVATVFLFSVGGG